MPACRLRLKIDKVLARDRDLDLAILPVPNSFRPDVLHLSERVVSEEQTVFAIGSPRQTKFGISQGVIVQSGYLLGSLRQLIQADIGVVPGSRGSPLLDVNGNVLGVIAMTSPEDRNFTFAVHQQELRRLTLQASTPRSLSSN